MAEQEVLAKVQEIIREIFDDPTIVVTKNTTAADVEGWDSLEHINLITRIESAFHVKFSMREAAGFKNVGDMVDTILAKG